MESGTTQLPEYEGHVMMQTTAGFWLVKAHPCGTYKGEVATVDRNNVPSWITPALPVRFDLVRLGKQGKDVVAINLRFCPITAS